MYKYLTTVKRNLKPGSCLKLNCSYRINTLIIITRVEKKAFAYVYDLQPDIEIWFSWPKTAHFRGGMTSFTIKTEKDEFNFETYSYM